MGIPGFDDSKLERGVKALEKLAEAQARIASIEEQRRAEERESQAYEQIGPYAKKRKAG